MSVLSKIKKRRVQGWKMCSAGLRAILLQVELRKNDFWHPSTDINMKRLNTKEKAHVQLGSFSLCRCVPIPILKGVLVSHWEINKYPK